MRQSNQRPVYPGGLHDEGESLTMLRVLSTHLFLNQRLHPGLLELVARSGAQGVEIFAARQHFDYASREHVAELIEERDPARLLVDGAGADHTPRPRGAPGMAVPSSVPTTSA